MDKSREIEKCMKNPLYFIEEYLGIKLKWYQKFLLKFIKRKDDVLFFNSPTTFNLNKFCWNIYLKNNNLDNNYSQGVNHND